ncbi:hypothetical protein PACTADRAFT_50943 [Pachysolen tannophilus NRRL Y-2460]|uniref:Uncharacterized protein n=1 Tax=Pachysolen tannophilus NRRL Y-2460 TaxID=669874 RepID=A0A1E4TQM6_PACTA|nr:hypothetical protein PACTADRAFT_50943 [Pachysolen tannophilus NRRL Y-2460]
MNKDKAIRVTNFLKKFSPCDISDSLVKHGFPNGGFFPNLQVQSNFELPIVGEAYTVLYAPLDDPRPAISKSYIDSIPLNSVLIIATTQILQLPYAPYTRINNAMYGGLMSTRAKFQNCNGSIIFGRIRDIQEHNNLQYPVMSYGLGTTAPKPVLKLIGINVQLEIVLNSYPNKTTLETIDPGDLIIADENGMVRIPISKIDDSTLENILDYIPKRVKADQLVAEDINEGKEAAKSQKLRRSNL